ncbi:MAG: inositol monophosphatase family protein [Bdellovibrionia bacterium]
MKSLGRLDQKKKKGSRLPSIPLSSLAQSAVRASHAAGRVLMKYYQAPLKVAEKKGAGLVTQADFEAQAQAVQVLKKAFPQFGFLTEEAPEQLGQSPGRWIIDPLDGTTNFVHGFPMFCVSIAAEWEGVLVAGVIYHPIFKHTYVATLGGGAFLNGKPIHVSRTRKLSQALLTTGFTYRKDQYLKAEMKAFEYLSSQSRAVRRPGSAALDLAYTAQGVFDGFWESGLSPWDIAAGVLLVREAGGKVTGFSGQQLELHSGELMASNSNLHPKLISVMSRF